MDKYIFDNNNGLWYRDFIVSEVRYNILSRSNPERAEVLFTRAETDVKAHIW